MKIRVGGVKKDVSSIKIKKKGVVVDATKAFISRGGVKEEVWSASRPTETFNMSITANTTGYGLKSAWNAAYRAEYGEPIEGDVINVSISDGVIVGTSSGITRPSFDITDSFNGATINLTLGTGAYIVGRGGRGVGEDSFGSPRGSLPGGTALKTLAPVNITNNGTIAGGGGGGVGANKGLSLGVGYGGGGGAGNVVGQGGLGNIANGSPGTLTTGGAGAGAGSAGGDLGQAGEVGTAVYPAGFPGAGGKAIEGIDNVTFITEGTIIGDTV